MLALVPAVSAVAVLGRLHPDEVYQFLEPAFAPGARLRGAGLGVEVGAAELGGAARARGAFCAAGGWSG